MAPRTETTFTELPGNHPIPEAKISGFENDGLYRADPGLVKRLLDQSTMHGGLSFGASEFDEHRTFGFDALNSLVAQKGVTCIRPLMYGQKAVNGYVSRTDLRLDDENSSISFNMKMEGLLDPSDMLPKDPPEQSFIGTLILPLPKLDITIKRYPTKGSDGPDITYHFRLGRGGCTEFTTYVDGRGPTETDVLEMAGVLNLVVSRLMSPEEDVHDRVHTDLISQAANDATGNYRSQQALRNLWLQNAETYRYGALLYVPPVYLESCGRPGIFVATEQDKTRIPENFLTYLEDTDGERITNYIKAAKEASDAQSRSRQVAKVARMVVDAVNLRPDESVQNARVIINGFPRAFTTIQLLSVPAENGMQAPVSADVPNIYADRAIEWLLENREVTQQVVRQYRAMYRTVANCEPYDAHHMGMMDFDMIMESALAAKLPWLISEEGHTERLRKQFESLLAAGGTVRKEAMNQPDKQMLIDNAFEVLADMGVKLYAYIYSDTEGRPPQ